MSNWRLSQWNRNILLQLIFFGNSILDVVQALRMHSLLEMVLFDKQSCNALYTSSFTFVCVNIFYPSRFYQVLHQVTSASQVINLVSCYYHLLLRHCAYAKCKYPTMNQSHHYSIGFSRKVEWYVVSGNCKIKTPNFEKKKLSFFIGMKFMTYFTKTFT